MTEVKFMAHPGSIDYKIWLKIRRQLDGWIFVWKKVRIAKAFLSILKEASNLMKFDIWERTLRYWKTDNITKGLFQATENASKVF